MLKEQQIRDAVVEFQTIMKLKPPLNEKATLPVLIPLLKKCIAWIEPMDVFSPATLEVIAVLEDLEEGDMPEIDMASPVPPSEEELLEKIRTSLKLRELKDVAVSHEVFQSLFDKLDDYANVEILRDDMFEILAKQKIVPEEIIEENEETEEETESHQTKIEVPSLAINPKFKEACPPLSQVEFESLEDLILRDGAILQPILTWGGAIVDGHNRYAIAKKNGIPFATKEMPFETEDEVIVWIKENAVSQRNLPEFVRFEMIKDIEVRLKEMGKARRKFRGIISPSVQEEFSTRKTLAEKANMSPAQIQKAQVVAKEADEETKEQLRAGKIKLGTAHAALKQRDTTLSTEMRIKKATREFSRWSIKYSSFLEKSNPVPEMTELISALDSFITELKRINGVD